MQFNHIFFTLAALGVLLIYTSVNATDQCPLGYPDQFPFNWEKACIEVESLLYDNANSANEIDPNTEADLIVVGGIPPFKWFVNGKGFYLDAEHLTNQQTSNLRNVKIFTKDACGYCEVIITDSCGRQVTGSVLSTAGSWKRVGTIDVCQREFLDDLGLFGCSFYAYPKTVEIPARFGRYSLDANGAETMNKSYIRNSWYCSIRAGDPATAPDVVNYNPPEWPSVDVPILQAADTLNSCAGASGTEHPGQYKWYRHANSSFPIYEYVCP